MKLPSYSALKPSGADWLGHVPKHWEVLSIKRLTPVSRGASPRPIEDPKYFDDEGEYAWVRIADVTSNHHYLSNRYRSGGEENRYKDEIRREPLELTDSQIPITTVSKAYSLVQHREVIASTFRALQLIKKDISGTEATLLLSEYGERMHWSCQIPGFDFEPGDKNPIVLRISCLNSVDTTTVLEISLSWYRLICSNGMMFGLASSKLRKRHIRSLEPEDIVNFLQSEFEESQKEQGVYESWYKQKVERERIESWVDEHVAKEWGPHAACRIS